MTRELESLKNLHFNRLLLTKFYNVRAKKVQRSYVWLHSRLAPSLKENWLVVSKIDMRNLANFNQSTWSLQIGTLITYFCLKLKMYELKIYRRVICYNNVYSVRPPQTFQVQAKISTVQSVFADYLSVSYDYCYKFITVQGK